MYQKISSEVKKLADEKLLFQQIARRLDVDRNTVTQAWKFWHVSRGLPVPTGHQRRKTANLKNENPRRRRGADGDEHRSAA